MFSLGRSDQSGPGRLGRSGHGPNPGSLAPRDPKREARHGLFGGTRWACSADSDEQAVSTGWAWSSWNRPFVTMPSLYRLHRSLCSDVWSDEIGSQIKSHRT